MVLLDNDVALKVCRYALHEEALAALSRRGPVAVLGTAKYVLPPLLARARGVGDGPGAAAALDRLLAAAEAVEPSGAEVGLAAAFEEEALRLGAPLDGGESLLLAVLVLRPADLMLTGDKRAVGAAGRVLADPHAGAAAGRVACLEQLAATLLAVVGVDAMRARVCADAAADKSLAVCFACASPRPCAGDDALVGLSSYVRHLRGAAPGLLVPSDDLSAALAA